MRVVEVNPSLKDLWLQTGRTGIQIKLQSRKRAPRLASRFRLSNMTKSKITSVCSLKS